MFPWKLFEVLLVTNAYIKTVYANGSRAKKASLSGAAKEVSLVKLCLLLPWQSLLSVPLGTDGIDLVDEDDGRRVLLGHTEQLPHQLRAVTQVLLDQL